MAQFMHKKEIEKGIFSGGFKMRVILGCLLLILSGNVFAQETSAVDIAVRVHDGDRFVDTLTLEDFEILEEGKPQKIEALYLVRGQNIIKRQEIQPFAPVVGRHFYLLFQSVDYDSKFGEAVDHLFKNILRPGDTMTLMTPMKVYSLNEEALVKKPAESLSKEMQQILRKDIQRGGGDYRDIIKDLRRLVRSIGGDSGVPNPDMEGDAFAGGAFGLEMQIDRYKQNLMKLENIRLVDENKMLGFASSLRTLPGQKIVFFFYQREFRPEISPQAMNQMMSMYQDQPNILSDLQDLFSYYRREAPFNSRRVAQAFSDAGLSLNFIFMNKEAQYIFGATMREQSEDIFSIFSDIARTTGGLSDMSQNPATSFKSTSQAFEDYYLLYYTPSDPAPAGSFRTVEAGVPGRDYTVHHRRGYLRN